MPTLFRAIKATGRMWIAFISVTILIGVYGQLRCKLQFRDPLATSPPARRPRWMAGDARVIERLDYRGTSGHAKGAKVAFLQPPPYLSCREALDGQEPRGAWMGGWVAAPAMAAHGARRAGAARPARGAVNALGLLAARARARRAVGLQEPLHLGLVRGRRHGLHTICIFGRFPAPRAQLRQPRALLRGVLRAAPARAPAAARRPAAAAAPRLPPQRGQRHGEAPDRIILCQRVRSARFCRARVARAGSSTSVRSMRTSAGQPAAAASPSRETRAHAARMDSTIHCGFSACVPVTRTTLTVCPCSCSPVR